MSPHHFARLNKNKHVAEAERELEEKVDIAIKATVAIIAAPLKVVKSKKDHPKA